MTAKNPNGRVLPTDGRRSSAEWDHVMLEELHLNPRLIFAAAQAWRRRGGGRDVAERAAN